MLKNLVDLENVLKKLAAHFDHKTVVLISGPLGIGKTKTVEYILKSLGAEDVVSSPTFAIHQSYTAKKMRVEHFDLYRIENASDLETTGLWDTLAEPGIVLIEWAERLPRAFQAPGRTLISLNFSWSGEDRELQIVSCKS